MSRRRATEAPWFPLPMDVAHAAPVRRLCVALRDPVAWGYLFHAWVDCRRNLPARVFVGAEAAECFESAAAWRGRRGRLASVAREVGILREVDGGLYLVSEQEVMAGADWTRVSSPAASDLPEDKAEERRRKDRERKARKAAEDRARKAAEEAAEFRGSSAEVPRKAAESSAENATLTPDSARETETKTKTETGKSEEPSALQRASGSPTKPNPDADDTGRQEALPGAGLQEPRAAARRKPRKLSAHQSDGEAWLSKARDLAGKSPADWPTPKGFWPRWADARKRYSDEGDVTHDSGSARLLRSLDGHARDPRRFWLGKGLMSLLSDSAIQSGLDAAGRSAGPHERPAEFVAGTGAHTFGGGYADLFAELASDLTIQTATEGAS